MFDNIVILSFYVIALIAAFLTAETIAVLVYESYESKLKYGSAKAGQVLKPNDKKCKFNVIVRNILAKLRFN
jgi:hypothetical protein